jgi:hypothetical protein
MDGKDPGDKVKVCICIDDETDEDIIMDGGVNDDEDSGDM